MFHLKLVDFCCSSFCIGFCLDKTCLLAVSDRFVLSYIRPCVPTRSSTAWHSDPSTIDNKCRWKCNASACNGSPQSPLIFWCTTLLCVRWFRCWFIFWIVDAELHCMDVFDVEAEARLGTESLRETRLFWWNLVSHKFFGVLAVYKKIISCTVRILMIAG